jgi:cation:H+ antiporter
MVLTDVALLLIALVVILVGAELFTNGIEWFGHKLGLGEGAVGSVLAAVGTAMPETMIPIIAILFSTGDSGHEIGVGAVLGAPFMLATLAMFVTGVAVVARARARTSTAVLASAGTAVETGAGSPGSPAATGAGSAVATGAAPADVMSVDKRVLSHDLRYFAVCYGLAIAVAFVPPDIFVVRVLVAVVLVGIYGWYVKEHFGAEAPDVEVDLAPLRFHRLDRRAYRADPGVPRLAIVVVQVLFSLACIIVGAFVFVDAVGAVSMELGVDQALLALVIAPIATELPEKFNSIIWVRQGKDTLAMGNITGAMVFQSAIPIVVALLFAGAAWTITEGSLLAFASAGIAFASVFVIFGMGRGAELRGRRLLVGGVFSPFVGLLAAGTSWKKLATITT